MTRKPLLLVELSPSGGLFQFAFELGSALAARGERVELWTGPRPEMVSSQPGFVVRPVLPTWHPADVRVRSRPFRLMRRALRAAQLVLAWVVLSLRLVVARPYAVLWSQWRFSFEPMFVVALSKLLTGTLFGLIAHEPLPRSDAKDTSSPKTGGLVTGAFGAAWRSLDVAFTLGPRTRELAVQHWEPRCPVYLIPHGPEPGLRGPDIRVVPVTETEPVALFFGVWTKYKGIDVLLDAFALVRRELPEARLVLAGTVGADLDIDHVLERAREVGNVDARSGYVPIDEVAPLLNSARVVVTPYIRATQSGVAHLAYTFGRPVVATATGDLPESVRDGVTGLLVEPGNSAELANAMLKLLADPRLAAQLGESGERSVAGAWAAAAATICEALTRAGGGNAAISS
ncbi:glycosyl transferase group 1 [Mycolicibacterium rhodesiae JS60]|nr:glycosyl transferase group 1 [Mycolicibacterium rhodesiae JS60]